MRWRWAVVAAITLGVPIWRGFVVHWIEPHPEQVDRGRKSSDLPGDLRLTRETSDWNTLGPRNGSPARVSTARAVNAASRVFNTVALVGTTRAGVWELLGYRAPNDGPPNAFCPAPAGALVYEFSSGGYGWRFHVILSDDGRVRAVTRHWMRLL